MLLRYTMQAVPAPAGQLASWRKEDGGKGVRKYAQVKGGCDGDKVDAGYRWSKHIWRNIAKR